MCLYTWILKTVSAKPINLSVGILKIGTPKLSSVKADFARAGFGFIEEGKLVGRRPPQPGGRDSVAPLKAKTENHFLSTQGYLLSPALLSLS